VKKKLIILVGLLIFIIIGVFFGYKMLRPSNVVKEGNITYYLNKDKTIKYAERKEDNKIIEYQNFYPSSIYNKGQNKTNIQYATILDDSGNINRTTEKEQNTGKSIAIYSYYPNAKYDENYLNKVKYIHVLEGDSTTIKYTIGKAENTGAVISYITYYPDTAYNVSPMNHIEFTYSMDTKGNIRNGSHRPVDSTTVDYYFEYGTYISFEERDNSPIQKIYYIDENNFITYSVEKNEAGEEVKQIEYLPETKYGEHKERVKQETSLVD